MVKRSLSRAIVVAVAASLLGVAGMPVAHADSAKSDQSHGWHCSRPVPPEQIEAGTPIEPCPARFTSRNHLLINDGRPTTITPEFDNQLQTPMESGQWVAVFLHGDFVQWSEVFDDGTVIVQPTWSGATRGKQRIAFYDTDSRLIGWSWVTVDWAW